jgi:hypothetical protein
LTQKLEHKHRKIQISVLLKTLIRADNKLTAKRQRTSEEAPMHEEEK